MHLCCAPCTAPGRRRVSYYYVIMLITIRLLLSLSLKPGHANFFFCVVTSLAPTALYPCCRVRGAPAIAIVGVLSLVIELRQMSPQIASVPELVKYITSKLEYLVTARPTAVNMSEACVRLSAAVRELADAPDATAASVQATMVAKMEQVPK